MGRFIDLAQIFHHDHDIIIVVRGVFTLYSRYFSPLQRFSKQLVACSSLRKKSSAMSVLENSFEMLWIF